MPRWRQDGPPSLTRQDFDASDATRAQAVDRIVVAGAGDQAAKAVWLTATDPDSPAPMPAGDDAVALAVDV